MALSFIAAAVLMTGAMCMAANSLFWTCGVLSFLVVFLIVLYHKLSWIRTRFFLWWSLTSFLFLLGVFELEVVPYLEILFIENFLLMCFVALMCMSAYLARARPPGVTDLNILGTKTDNCKSDYVKLNCEMIFCETCNKPQPPKSMHCILCDQCINRRDHHSVWLDVCIGGCNRRYYICGNVALLLVCLYGANLMLTTVCHPTLIGGFLLFPDDCSDVYEDFHIAICFVSAVYLLIVSVFVSLFLICKLVKFVQYISQHKHRTGLFSKELLLHCYDVWLGIE